MKKYLHKIALATLALGVSITCVAQDIHFSQLSETPLLRNPALAGLFSGDVRVQSVFRTQWNSVANPYKTVSSNIEFKMGIGGTDDFVTMGGQVLYDKAGSVDLSATHVLPVINYHKSLSSERSTYLSLAAMGGIVQRSVDPTKMSTNSQYNGGVYVPGSGTGENVTKPTYSYFDATVGMSFNTQLGERVDDNMYVGVAYHHFNKAKNTSFYSDSRVEVSPKWVVSAGVRTAVDDYSSITIEGDHNKQSAYSSTLVGVMYARKLDAMENPKYIFHLGAYYRLADAVIPVIKLEARPFSISMSYDANTSQLRNASFGRGGFEFSLAFQKFNSGDFSSLESTKCPKF